MKKERTRKVIRKYYTCMENEALYDKKLKDTFSWEREKLKRYILVYKIMNTNGKTNWVL